MGERRGSLRLCFAIGAEKPEIFILALFEVVRTRIILTANNGRLAMSFVEDVELTSS